MAALQVGYGDLSAVTVPEQIFVTVRPFPEA
jgi:hypothetical protein